MISNLINYLFGKDKSNECIKIEYNEYIKIIREFYVIQHIYCENCIRNYNKPCKMSYVEDNFICFECNKNLNINYIDEQDFIFDKKELKKYIIENFKKAHLKIKCLLIYWKQPKNIITDNKLIDEIILDILQDNYEILFQYNPYYLPV